MKGLSIRVAALAGPGWEVEVEQIHPRCAGIDIGKKRATVCIRVPGPNPSSRRAAERVSEQVTTWSSMTGSVLQLREQLIQAQVTCVVMEATSDYWKPFYFLLEDAGFELMLVNARHVKNMPGRKTDVTDAAWLAQLGAHGLVKVAGLGKIKTIVQMVAISCLLFSEPFFGLPIFRIGEWLLAAAAALTLWSGADYVRAAWPAMSRH